MMLLSHAADGDLELVLTRRRDDLSNHPGQISFPGGRVDPGETIDAAAVREATEEVALDPRSVELLGRMPAFYIPPSRFWLQAAVARWAAPHPLVAAEAEVAEILHVRTALLRDPDRWRVVRLSTAGATWAWQLDDGHLLWGATAVLTAMLLGIVDPGWHGGADLERLGADREVRPWEGAEATVPRAGRARVAGVREVAVSDPLVRAAATDGVVDEQRGAAAVAAAVHGLLHGVHGRRVTVLAGPGATGRVGRAAAALLAAAGAEVTVLADPVGSLPPSDVVVDALVGTGLAGTLRGSVRALALLLREHAVPVCSVDVPSGLDPRDGLVGEAVTADVTVAVGAPAAGLFLPGLGPFVGDLYLATPAGDPEPLVRLVPGADADRWRE
jgi:NAD(P)H-hydrate repair Nnr-like enzyme with NAD(P)H-hydrate epimerase domain/8-oxo-dGTP pyrophosphatase MutT (NUDIX family)